MVGLLAAAARYHEPDELEDDLWVVVHRVVSRVRDATPQVGECFAVPARRGREPRPDLFAEDVDLRLGHAFEDVVRASHR